MNCPYCASEMEKGYIDQGRFSLYWVSEKRKPASFFPVHKNIKLTSLPGGGRITTYRCENCRKLVIDEDDIDV